MELRKKRVLFLFKSHLTGKSYSPYTIKRYVRDSREFCSWLYEQRNKDDIREVSKDDIIQYCLFLEHAQKSDGSGKRFSDITRKGIINVLRSLFRFLSRYDYCLSNPFDKLDLVPISVKHLREGMAEQEINGFLDSLPVTTPFEIRDRVIFEVMYGTGIRVGEIVNIDLVDIDLKNGRLLIRRGKGNKDRVVPLGANVIRFLELYLKQGRDYFLEKVKNIQDQEALFLNCTGRRIGTSAIRIQLQKLYTKVTGSKKNVCPHMLRHSFATHVLQHGAGVKKVKDILGHSHIESTIVYTHFSVKNMKRIIKQYHPRENELYTELTQDEQLRIERILLKSKY